MLFFNISSDQIVIQGEGVNLLVPYEDLERKLPEIVGELNDKQTFKTVRVLNGPGGFTLLRIGCLVLNTMQMALDGKLRFYSCTKLELYEQLIKKGLLPPTGIIFIGQRKNVRWSTYNIATGLRDNQTLPADSVEHMKKSGDYFVDIIYDHPLKEIVGTEKMVDMHFENDHLNVTRQNKTEKVNVDELSVMSATYLQPEYMMQPELNGEK